MATSTRTESTAPPEAEAGRVVLRDVPWAAYEMLRAAEANRHVRMAYDDGRLELMSPLYRHERDAGRLGKVVMAVAVALGLPCAEARTTTFRKPGPGPRRGQAAEADTSFYLANEPRIRDRDAIDLAVDPPPDLAVEVDHTSDSLGKFPIYAALGVPEVWRFDGRSLAFRRLGPDGAYAEVESSPALPGLTPALVLGWLRRAEGIAESAWMARLPGWIRDELPGAG